MGGMDGESPHEGKVQQGIKPAKVFQDLFTSSRKVSLALLRREPEKKLKVKSMYTNLLCTSELYYLLSKFKPVTTSANPLLAPGTDLGQPVLDSTIQWHILGFQGRPGPSSSSAAHGRGLLTPMATQMEQPREERNEEEHQRSSKQGGLMQK